MEGFPAAIIMARRDDVIANPNILYRLVKPNRDRDGVESAAGLVNVVPQRRKYRMERKSELETFERELLRRPLVLQPISTSGVGIYTCGLWTKTEQWVLLINQTHPKILGRIQIGVDAAKAAMGRGDPFQLRYLFGTVIRRLHHQVVERMDAEVLESRVRPFLYADWDFAELVVRYYGSGLRRRVGYKPVNLDFDFSDLTVNEIQVRAANSVLTQEASPITGEELAEMLPAWTVNHISPLAAEGEALPDTTYSYAQAGRLYQSYRKKKRQRPIPSDSSQEPSSPQDMPGPSNAYPQASASYPQGAAAYPQASAPYPQASAPYPQVSGHHPKGAAVHSQASAPYPRDFEEVALDDVQAGAFPYPGRSPRVEHCSEDEEVEMYDRQARQREQDWQDDSYEDQGYYPRSHPPPSGYPVPQTRRSRGSDSSHHTPQGVDSRKGPAPRRENLYPEVRVMGESYAEEAVGEGRRDWTYRDRGERLRDSDRSSHSTAASSGPADSGYADSDLDLRPPTSGSRGRGRLNPAFRHDEEEVDDIMKRHEQMVKSSLGTSSKGGDKLYPVLSPAAASGGARPKVPRVPLLEEGMAESYI